MRTLPLAGTTAGEAMTPLEPILPDPIPPAPPVPQPPVPQPAPQPGPSPAPDPVAGAASSG